MSLDELAEFTYGFTAKAQAVGSHRFIRITDIGENGQLVPSDVKYIDAGADSAPFLTRDGDLLMARTGATYAKTLLVRDDSPAVFASYLIRIRFPTGALLPAFYWHFAQSTNYWSQARALVSEGGQPQFNANALRQIQVPVPPLADQSRIVDILDAFDVLVNDLSSGLPAEIAARRKQYEFYRDRLLTFSELA